MKMLELAGQQFGRLTVVTPSDRRSGQNVMWWCKCECGEFVEVAGHHLKDGSSRSCGCYWREVLREVHKGAPALTRYRQHRRDYLEGNLRSPVRIENGRVVGQCHPQVTSSNGITGGKR